MDSLTTDPKAAANAGFDSAAIGVATPLAEACAVLWGEAAAQLGPTADHTEYGREKSKQ